jgi:putative salt-induced outer membrane protein YdiY
MRDSPLSRASLILLLLLVLQPLAAAGAFVDKITTKDGSVLLGEIKRVENDELVLDTDYADDVVIDVEHIAKIESKQHFSIRLITGEIISGYVAVSDGKFVLREKLPAPGESTGADDFRKIDPVEPASEAPPTMPPPGTDEVVQQTQPTDVDEVVQQAQPTGVDEVVHQAPPTPESQPQLTTPDDLPRDEAAAETPESADDWISDREDAVERPDGRKFSFDDVDWIREKPTYLRYDADLNVAVQLARGNTDTTDLHFDTRFEPSFGWNTFRLTGQFDKKSADGETTTNRWKAALIYERDFHRRWYVGAANTYESDSQRDLDLRWILAAGIGYRFFDQDPTHLSVLPALAYVNENFDEFIDPVTNVKGDSDDTDYAAFQLSIDFTRDLYKDDITFFHNNMYLGSLQSISDIIVETRTGIKFDMAWDLVLSAEVETDWENEPAEDAKKWDTRYMLKIGFEFEGDENDWFQ